MCIAAVLAKPTWLSTKILFPRYDALVGLAQTWDDIRHQSFQGRHGRAYLFNKCVNVSIGPKEERPLITGLHVVADIYCIECQSLLGWKYVRAEASLRAKIVQEEAYEESQKYKVGKFIIEKAKMLKEDGTWDD